MDCLAVEDARVEVTDNSDEMDRKPADQVGHHYVDHRLNGLKLMNRQRLVVS